MNAVDFTPKPTDYIGVRFRSKSEAIFARALELRGLFWQYEPENWRCEDGWVPDFWAAQQRTNPHRIFSLIIEYKPSRVTDAYKEQLHERFMTEDIFLGHYPVLACGNAFNPERETFLMENDGWEPWETDLKLFLHIEEAARYRFDLA